MSRHARIEVGRIDVEQGRALALVSRPSFLGRLAGFGARTPLRLVAVPRDPIAGDKLVGADLAAGTFRLGRHALPVVTLSPADAALPAAVGERLHSFAWLRDLAAAVPHGQGRAVAETITRAWLEALPARQTGLAWRADLVGKRILFWAAYAPYLLSTRDTDYRTRMLRLVADSARYVMRQGDRAPAGLPRIAAWAGAVAAGLVLQGAPGQPARGEKGLEKALRLGIGEDGGLLSRTPYEQLDLVETLALLRAAYATTAEGFPDWLRDAQEGAVSALLTATMGDAALGSWQGGNPASAQRLVAAFDGAGADAGPLRQARGWGYQRLQAKDGVLIIDAAPPPRAANGCASTLAFEYSDGPQRVFVNCGGGGGAPDALSGELVPLLRSTAAHSTLVLGDTNSTAVLDAGGLGRGVEEVNLERGRRDDALTLEASHDGYVRKFGFIHQRALSLSGDGKMLAGQDGLIPAPRAKAGTSFSLRFHLAPGLEVAPTADGRGALLRARGGTGGRGAWTFKCRGGALGIEESLWIDGDGDLRPTQQLVVSGDTPAEGITLSWELKRAG